MVPCPGPDLERTLPVPRPGALCASTDRCLRRRARDVGQRLHAGPAPPLVGAGPAPHAGLAHPLRERSGVDLRQDDQNSPPLATEPIIGLSAVLVEEPGYAAVRRWRPDTE